MGLESTVVCVDNSEYSRNGDFTPTRYGIQVDLVNMLCSSKIGANPESTVGLLSMAGRSARILVTSTRDLGQVFTCMHGVKYDGNADIFAGIQKAQLALKHRQNMMQRQRIVVFLTSPIQTETDKLITLAKKLKKNSVAVDIVNIGGEEENLEKVNTFIETVNNSDNSHALHIPAPPSDLQATFRASPVFLDADAQNNAPAAPAAPADGGGGNANEFPFGVDPQQDPELAMVLRISMEEEKQRQAKLKEQEGQGAGASESKNNGDGEYDDDDDIYAGGEGKDKMEVEDSAVADDEVMDEETKRAIELSMTGFEAPKDDDGKDKS